MLSLKFAYYEKNIKIVNFKSVNKTLNKKKYVSKVSKYYFENN